MVIKRGFFSDLNDFDQHQGSLGSSKVNVHVTRLTKLHTAGHHGCFVGESLEDLKDSGGTHEGGHFNSNLSLEGTRGNPPPTHRINL